MKVLHLLLRLLFGGLFIYAGWMKARDPGLFLLDVRSFNMLPDPYAAWLAMGLPWLEILAGLAVITGVALAGGLLVLNGCLVVFLGAIAWAGFHGIDIQCGCFGGDAGSSSHVTLVVRDLLLLALGVYLQIQLWPAARARR